jgi:hypothetical protein
LFGPGSGISILTRGRKTRSPIEIKLSARPEYLATSLGCTLRDSKTAVVSLALSMQGDTDVDLHAAIKGKM